MEREVYSARRAESRLREVVPPLLGGDGSETEL